MRKPSSPGFFFTATPFSIFNTIVFRRFFLLLTCTVISLYTTAQSPGGVSAGLSLWVKAGEGVLVSGSNVTDWQDQSGAAKHLISSTATYQPQYVPASAVFNFNPYIDFNGDFLRYSGNVLSKNSNASVFTVANYTGTGSGYASLWDFYSNDPTVNVLGSNWLFWHGGGKNHTIPVVKTKPTLVGASWEHNISASSRFAVDGRSEALSRSVNTNGNNYFLGAGSTGAAERWIGGIAENIVYDEPLTGNALEQVNSYLAIKYGITLDNDPASTADNYTYRSASGAVIWDGDVHQTYHHHVTGIGRDDQSALLQLKSQSVHGGAVLTIETGAFAGDESFLVTGNNGGKAGYVTGYSPNSFTPATPYFHFGRIWKVQETGTVGSVTLTINSNSATHLLVHNSDDFSTGSPVEIALTGGQVSVDLSDGEFFTFAGPATGPGGVVNNLAVWLKADEGTNTTTNGAAVSSWADQSGNDRTHEQATATKQPSFVGAGDSRLMNYNPALRFTGVANSSPNNSYLTAANYLNTTDAFHVFSVSRIEGAGVTSWQTIYSFTADVTHPDWYSQQVSCRVGGAEKINNSKDIKYGLSSALMPKSGQQRVIWNGTVQSFSNSSYSITTVGSPDFSLGVDRNNSDPFTGDIQEVIVFAEPSGGDLPANDIARVQSYLALKYGISLDPAGQADYLASDGATQIWTGSVNTGYQQNIFGLGRDDNSGLYQKQAFSYGDSTISIFLGSLAPLNGENSSVIAADESFLVLGDNNATGFVAGLNTPAGHTFANGTASHQINQLSARIWKAQATGQPNWTIHIHNNKFLTTHSVLVSADPSFDPSVTRIYPLVSGVAENVQVGDGDYIAFASFAMAPGGVVAGLDFWVKSDGAIAGEAWPDFSPHGNPIETVGAPSLAAADAQHNFYPYYTGFSSSNYFRDADPSLTEDNTYGTHTRSPYSLFSAVRSTAAQGAGTGRIIGIDDDNFYAAEPGFSLYNGNPHFYKFYESAGSNTYTQDVVSQKSSVISYVADQGANAGNGTMAITLDGRSELFNRSSGSYFHVLGKNLFLGYGTWDINGAFPGDIMEVAWYKRTLSTDEISRVHAYMALKNGVTLGSASDPLDYLNTSSEIVWPADGDFQHNIAGIGRDDIEGLNQKQANSVNPHTTGQVTVSLGIPAAGNAANTAVLPDDKTYLIWGDNGITTVNTSLVTDYGVGTNINHLQRIWKVMNTGLQQPVHLVFPSSLLPGSLTGPCEAYKLITASGETISGASITSVVSLTEEGGQYVAMYTFPAGASYFTLARVDPSTEGEVYLPDDHTLADQYADCSQTDWYYFKEDGVEEHKLFAASGFSAPELANLTINIVTSGAGYASLARETYVMPRITTVTDISSGVYSGGRVRVYFSQDELNNTTIPGALTNSWIKYAGDAQAVLDDVLDNGLFTPGMAVPLVPDATGEEDGVPFVEFHNITSFSSFLFVSSTESMSVLPITLKEFTATRNGSVVQLDWSTVQEQRNAGFEVERRQQDGQWKRLGFIPSLAEGGNSEVLLKYRFVDRSPAAGTNAYRLKQLNQDGKYDYSRVVVVMFNPSPEIKLAPNPVVKGAVRVGGLKPGDKLQVLGLSGQVLITKQATGNWIDLDLSAHSRGIYPLVVTSGEEKITLKIIKAN